MTGIAERISVHTGLPEAVVRRIARTAPVRYKEYTIPKRNGGYRRISQPARELKILQRSLIDILLNQLPIHDSAMAYREGLSICENAARHAQNGPILKMDFKDFFPSIIKNDWTKYCRKNCVITDHDDLDITSSILFRKPKGGGRLQLAIGAPSSPILSNILMFEFDKQLVEKLSEDGVIYTRYADDLTFSAPRTGFLNRVIKNVRDTIREISHPNLTINEEKTTFVTKKYHRVVTGLTLSNDGRVTVGRARKRLLRSMIHRASIGELDQESIEQLAGYIAFVQSVEPDFIADLLRRYDPSLLRSIKSAPFGRREGSN